MSKETYENVTVCIKAKNRAIFNLLSWRNKCFSICLATEKNFVFCRLFMRPVCFVLLGDRCVRIKGFRYLSLPFLCTNQLRHAATDKFSVLLMQGYCELLKDTVNKNSFIVQQTYKTYKYKSLNCFLSSRWSPNDAALCQFMLLKLFCFCFLHRKNRHVRNRRPCS
jgi:hypothetical protein